jgi:hypothetical protein
VVHSKTASAAPTTGTVPGSIHNTLLDRVVQDTPAPELPAGAVVLASVADIDANGQAWLRVPGIGRVKAVHSLVALLTAQIGQQVAASLTQDGALVLGVLWQPPAQAPQLQVDGLRQVIHAEQEIELRCGEAAIVLTADGHIQLRGTYITSQASATQRILGGSVNVN